MIGRRRWCAAFAVLAINAVVSTAVAPASAGQITYRSAVVEYAAKRVPNASLPTSLWDDNSLTNARNFEPFVQQASESGCQIIVFPEYGVTGAGFELADRRFTRNEAEHFCEAVPEPSTTSLCTDQTDDHPLTTQLACLAQKYKIVLVANLLDRVPCPENIFLENHYPNFVSVLGIFSSIVL